MKRIPLTATGVSSGLGKRGDGKQIFPLSVTEAK